jgi:hypothetical protein
MEIQTWTRRWFRGAQGMKEMSDLGEKDIEMWRKSVEMRGRRRGVERIWRGERVMDGRLRPGNYKQHFFLRRMLK